MIRTRQWRKELARIEAAVRRFSRRPPPRLEGETRLRAQVRQRLRREARCGLDSEVEWAVGRVIDSHVVELRTELLRAQQAEDAEFAELESRLDGLVVKYDAEEQHQAASVKLLRYKRQAALRQVENRDTPMPAGPDGIEAGGHQIGNVGELAGHGLRTRIILLSVLFLAMVADLVVFEEVVERVLNESRGVLPLVAGIVVTTTYVAHKAGELFKTARQVAGSIRRAVGGWTLLAVWTGMGVSVFVFRLLAPRPVSNGEAGFMKEGIPGGDGPAYELVAVLLLLLYVVTGTIAVTAGYQRPRDEIGQYWRTNRALRRAEPRLAARQRIATEAAALRERLAKQGVERQGQYAFEIDRCEAAARRLKAEAAMEIQRLRRAGQPS